MAKKSVGRPRTKATMSEKDLERYELAMKKKLETYSSVRDINRREPLYSEDELKKITIAKQFNEREIGQAYLDFYQGRASLGYLCLKLNISRATLKKYFAGYNYLVQKKAEEEEFRRWKAERLNSTMRMQENTENGMESPSNSSNECDRFASLHSENQTNLD